jgi:small subunit ribosomal protein S21
MEVIVHGRSNLEMAIRAFRKKAQKDGMVKEARRRKAFEKPSEKIKRRKDESVSRRKKARRGEYVS